MGIDNTGQDGKSGNEDSRIVEFPATERNQIRFSVAATEILDWLDETFPNESWGTTFPKAIGFQRFAFQTADQHGVIYALDESTGEEFELDPTKPFSELYEAWKRARSEHVTAGNMEKRAAEVIPLRASASQTIADNPEDDDFVGTPTFPQAIFRQTVQFSPQSKWPLTLASRRLCVGQQEALEAGLAYYALCVALENKKEHVLIVDVPGRNIQTFTLGPQPQPN